MNLYNNLSKKFSLDEINAIRENSYGQLSQFQMLINPSCTDNVDIIVGLCYLYFPLCTPDEIQFWLKKEWNLEIPMDKLGVILHYYHSRRMFVNYRDIIILDKKKLLAAGKSVNINAMLQNKTIIEYENFYYTKLHSLRPYAILQLPIKSGKEKTKGFGLKSDVSAAVNNLGAPAMINEILSIKRFCNMYDVSDFLLIDSFESKNNLNLPANERNKLVANSQLNYLVKYTLINQKFL